MFGGKRVAVVVPAFEEEERIERTLRGIPVWVDGVVVVDDGSQDRTSERARELGDARVVVERHERNRGVGRAIATGTVRAFEEGAEIVVVMAGDAQMDPNDLVRVVAPLLVNAADYVKGNRFLHDDARAMPFLRRLGSRVLAVATNWASGGRLRVDDGQCGYTALGRKLGESLPWDSLWDRYGYPNDLLLLLAARGARIVEVPVRPVYAGEKSGLRFFHVATILGVILRRLWLDFDAAADGEREHATRG